MNNSEIAAAFVAMVNNQQEKKTVNGRNNLSIRVVGYKLALYSYSTPIAVYNGSIVVVNQTYLSSSTSKHQSALNCSRFNCRVSLVYHFGGFCGNSYGFESPAAYTVSDLLRQVAPLYSYQKRQYLSKNNRIYYRYTLLKDEEGAILTYQKEIHSYTSEQAAKDEMSRLNRLAVAAA